MSEQTTEQNANTINVKPGEVIGVTKMSVNQICGKRVMGDICVIIGKANGLKTGEGTDGQVWTALTGVFEGTNMKTGERFRSGKLFLPAGTQEAVEAAVKMLPESGGAVKFAIGFRRVETDNPIGYSYQTINLLPMESQTDDLADLIAAARAKVPTLAAPAVSESKQIEAPSTEAPVTTEAPAPKAETKGGKKK